VAHGPLARGPVGRVWCWQWFCLMKSMVYSRSSACYEFNEKVGGNEDAFDLITQDTALPPHPSKQGLALHDDLIR
jgi:hypothetical protein